jgi:glycosyltransferase involved in cell wall biosynthesis
MNHSSQSISNNLLSKLTDSLVRYTRFLQPSFIIRHGQQYPPKKLQPPLIGENFKPPPDPPLISIVIPSFNQAKYLETCIKSILNQNFSNLELIIVDADSSDGSKEIIKKYESKLHWWCSEPDSGQTNGLNKGFQHATGEIMAWLNSDDQLLPGTLARIAAYMKKNPSIDAVYGHRIIVDEQGMDIGRWILAPHNNRVMSYADFIPQETLFWRRSIWERVGGKLDESFQFAMDWDMLLRFRDAGAIFVRMPNFIGLFRVHDAQKTSAEFNTVGVAESQKLLERTFGYQPEFSKIILGTVWYLFKTRTLELMWKAGMVRYE